MKIAEWCIKCPVSTIVGVLLVAVFGVVSIFLLPIQMKPTMDKPVIRIQTTYPGAAPPEIEEQITDKLEEQINSVEGLRKLSSESGDSYSYITMEFEWGVNRDARFVDVLQKVNQVENLPEQSERPVIYSSSSEDEDRIIWIMLHSKTLSVEEMSFFAMNEIKDTLERVDGVGDVAIYGKREREIWVVMDPEAMLARGLTISMVRNAILKENQNLRGGYIDEGKIRFNLRTIGQFKLVDEIKRMIVAHTQSGPVYMEEIAQVKDYYERVESVVRGNTNPMIAIGVARKIGANVIDVTTKTEAAIKKLNARFSNITYKGRPASLELVPVYRESDYIWESLQFLYDNLVMGSLLAIVILLLFLKSIRSTFIISVVIPVCFISIFIFLAMLDRSLNIISLAGIAFAVGMTVDNAIVVLENIYRHIEMGKSRIQASIDGTTEIWGAVLASTLTTIAVFVPVIYVKEEAGELFKDIAIAISFSVGMSMVVALTVVPMLCSRLLVLPNTNSWYQRLINIVFWIPDIIGSFLGGCFHFVAAFVTGKYFEQVLDPAIRFIVNCGVKLAITIVIAISAILVCMAYVPSLEYLPSGNQNFVLVLYKVHTGTNINKASEIALGMEKKVMAMLLDDTKGDTPENRLAEHMFSVVSTRFNVIGVVIKKGLATMPVSKLPMPINPMTQKPFGSAIDFATSKIFMMAYGTPGTEYAFAFKISLFDPRGKGFDVEIRGPDMDKLEEYATNLEAKLQELGKKMGFQRVAKDFETGLPEIRVEVDKEKAKVMGLSTSEVAEVVEAMVSGIKTGKFREGSEEFNIMVRGEESLIDNIEQLKQTPFVIANGGHTTIETVSNVHVSTGPTKIYHKERSRAITINVNLSDETPLEEAIMQAKQVIKQVCKDLPAEYSVEVTGAASDLERTKKAFFWSFILAVVITYLLMASLFESFISPLIIMFTVPLAVSGGIYAVYYNSCPMDMLTVLGFIILCGIVVNNAILIVHQTLNFRSEGMDDQEAIRTSVDSRLRPIFMSTLTTVLGLFPMCIKGAPGSELYSGLATAIAGGLMFSTLFTLVLIPALLSLIMDIKNIIFSKSNRTIEGVENKK